MKRKLALILIAVIAVSTFAAARPSTDIQIDKIKSEPVPLQTAEYADIWLKVTNEGDTKAENVKVQFREEFPFEARPGTKTSWNIGELGTATEYYIHLQVKVDENAVQGRNTLDFNVTSGTGNIVLEKDVPVQVRTDDPVLGVENVSFPEKVAPGSSNTMTLTLENMADSQLRNLEVSLNLADLPFAASTTNVRNLRTLEPGETAKLDYRLVVDSNAENGLYRVPVKMGFENEAGTEFTQDVTTGVFVGGQPELEVAVNDQELQTAGGTGTVTLRIINQGYGEADFVELSIPKGEGYEIVSQNSVYLGNMDPDDYQTAEFTVHASSSDVTLPVRLDYRTSEKSFEETRDVRLKLYSSDQLQRYGLAGGNNTWILVIAVLALVAGGAYYWRRRNRKER